MIEFDINLNLHNKKGKNMCSKQICNKEYECTLVVREKKKEISLLILYNDRKLTMPSYDYCYEDWQDCILANC